VLAASIAAAGIMGLILAPAAWPFWLVALLCAACLLWTGEM